MESTAHTFVMSRFFPRIRETVLGKRSSKSSLPSLSGIGRYILYAVPGKESFYRKLGFLRMTTAMAIFQNQSLALEWGLVNET